MAVDRIGWHRLLFLAIMIAVMVAVMVAAVDMTTMMMISDISGAAWERLCISQTHGPLVAD